MITSTRILGSYALIYSIAFAVCTTHPVPAYSKDRLVDVSFQVNMNGLDIDKPADAIRLYGRLKHAATIVCSHGMRVDLKPLVNPTICFENVVSDAVRSFNRPQLTAVYLKTRSIEEAATRGIDIPRLAAK